MSKPYYGLFLICARWRAGVPERTICQTILWFGQTMLWFGHKKGATAPARRGGNTPVGSDLALEGRKWVKNALLGGIGPVRAVRRRAKDPQVWHIDG